jgi:hypothetical protein
MLVGAMASAIQFEALAAGGLQREYLSTLGIWKQDGLHWLFQEVPMRKPNLSSASLDALLKLRDEIEEVLAHRAALLREELSKLGHQVGSKGKAGGKLA